MLIFVSKLAGPPRRPGGLVCDAAAQAAAAGERFRCASVRACEGRWELLFGCLLALPARMGCGMPPDPGVWRRLGPDGVAARFYQAV